MSLESAAAAARKKIERELLTRPHGGAGAMRIADTLAHNIDTLMLDVHGDAPAIIGEAVPADGFVLQGFGSGVALPPGQHHLRLKKLRLTSGSLTAYLATGNIS